MRELLASVGLMTLCLSGVAYADEADAVKVVEKLGGKIIRDDKQPGKPVVGVDLGLTLMTDAELKELKGFPKLLTLRLGLTGLTDAGMKELKEFTNLTTLELTGTKVTDAGLKELK